MLNQVEKMNFRHLVMDIAWFGLALPATARFMSVYAIRLGASAQELSWIASMPALVLLISAALGSWWRSQYQDSVRAVFWPGFGFRFIFLLPALTPFMPDEWQVIWLILSVSLPAIPQGIASVIFMVMMREAVEKGNLMKLLARRALALNVTVAVGGLAFGLWLEYAPFPLNYQLMYILAFVLTMISLWHVNKAKVIYAAPVEPETRIRPFASRDFRRVSLAVILVNMAFYSVLPLVTLYLVEEKGASESFIAIFALMELVAASIVSVKMAEISKWLGNRTMIAMAMVSTALSALMVVVVPDVNLTLIAAMVGGAGWTLAGNGLFGYFADNTSPEHMTQLTRVFNQMTFFGLFIGPMVGSALIGSGIDLLTVILVGAAMRLTAATLTWLDPLERWHQLSERYLLTRVGA